MKKLVAGLLVGMSVCIASISIAAPVNENILTEADPIYVNGSKYNKWNSQLKRVEIKTSTPAKQNKVYREYKKDVPNFAYVIGIPDGKRIKLSDGKTVLYKYDVTDATEKNLVKYEKALKKAGYVYEADTSTDEIVYYSKGKTVVGLWSEAYDFYVLVTTD